MTTPAWQFSAFPKSVQNAIIFLILGWAWISVINYMYVLMDESLRNYFYRILIVGGLICFFVANIKKWARMLCIFFNIGIMVVYPFLGSMIYLGSGQLGPVSMAAVAVILFGISTFYLLKKETGQFYKSYGQPADASPSPQEPD
jgi:hypothetical protein